MKYEQPTPPEEHENIIEAQESIDRIQKKEEILAGVRQLISRYGKVCLLSLGLLGVEAGKTFAQKPQGTRIEQADSTHIEMPKLREGEYIMPDTVMKLYTTSSQDSVMGYDGEKYLLDAAGMYIEHGEEHRKLELFLNFIFSRSDFPWKGDFSQQLSKLPLPPDSLQTLEDRFFKEGNILIIKSETANSAEFQKVLYHERIHKYTHEILTDHERNVLEKARVVIVADWKEHDRALLTGYKLLREKFGPKADVLENKEFGMALEELMLSNITALDKAYGGSEQGHEIYSVENDQEFYSSLMQAEHLEIFEEYLREHFPDAYEIFERMKSSVEAE